jgi:hypothetical protein
VILDQISAKWDADAALRTSAGPLFAGEVPEMDENGTPVYFPYTYCLIGATSFHYIMGVTNYLEATEVTFYTFCSGIKVAQEAVRLIQNKFSWETDLVFNDSNSSVFSIRPLNCTLDSQNARDKNGQPVYRGMISFLFTINRVEV